MEFLNRNNSKLFGATRKDWKLYVCISIYLIWTNGMCTIVDEKMIIAVEVQHVKPEHEALQDGVCLEGDDTV